MRLLSLLFFIFTLNLQAEESKWYDKFSMSGDFRYRYERKDEGSNPYKTQRDRIRVRLKSDIKVEENLDFIFRATTNQGDITSRNQSLDDGGSSKEYAIDMAYGDYKYAEHNSVLFGKMANPLYLPGKESFVFDTDWTPEGISLKGKFSKDSLSFFYSASSFWFQKGEAASEVKLYAPQVGATFKSGNMKATAGAGYYHFSSIQGTSTTNLASLGNSTTNSTLSFGYDLTELFLEVGTKLGEFDLSVFGSRVTNSEVSTNDLAYIIGTNVKYQKVHLSYNYRRVEKDSVLGMLADSNSFGTNGTDGMGHKTSVTYDITEKVSLKANYFAQTNLATRKHFDLLQVDLSLKF